MNKDLSLLKQLTSELLNNADDCGDYLATAATLVADDVEMLKRLEVFCKEPKVWAVTRDEVFECAVNSHGPKTFFSYDDALSFYNDCVCNAEHEYTERGWDKDEPHYDGGHRYFEMWDSEEGYVISHYAVSLDEVKIL